MTESFDLETELSKAADLIKEILDKASLAIPDENSIKKTLHFLPIGCVNGCSLLLRKILASKRKP